MRAPVPQGGEDGKQSAYCAGRWPYHPEGGQTYLSPGISEKVIEGYLEGKEDSLSVSSWQKLSQREREVLKLIAEGYKNKEIAEDLCISLKTVEKHRANLMKKLDLHNAAGLTVYAVGKGLVSR